MTSNSTKPSFVPTFQALDKDKKDLLIHKFMLTHNLNVLHQITDYLLQYATDTGILEYSTKALSSLIRELDIVIDDYLNKPIDNEK